MSLEKLHASEHQVLAVVTIPDKAQGRGQKLRPSPVKQFAAEHGLDLLQPVHLKEQDFIGRLRACGADAFVVVAFRILPPEVFTIPPLGTINVHASLLPKYRGAAPINWALINGEVQTGVTTMRIDARVDTGNILLQDTQEITPDMNAGQLHDLLAEKGANLLIKTLDRLQSGTLIPSVQDESMVSKAPKITKELARIDFSGSARSVHNLIRGLNPYPAAYCMHEELQLKLLKSVPIERAEAGHPAGRIVYVGNDFFDVACSSGAVRIYEVQLQGKKRLNVRDFLNGYTLKEGDFLR